MKESVFSERLKLSMKENGMKAVDLARKTGIPAPAISNWRSGYYKPNAENITKLAKALNVSVDWLSGVDQKTPASNISPLQVNKMRLINIYTYVSCGNGQFNDDYISDTISLPSELFSDGKMYFATYARGDSMINAGIKNGDLLIFEKTDIPQENKIGAFCIDNEIAVCKKYQSHNGIILLLSANDNYAPIVIDPMHNECFRVVGRLTYILSGVK